MIELTADEVIQQVAEEHNISYAQASKAAMMQFQFVAHIIRTRAPESVRLRYWGVYKPIPKKLKQYGYED